MKTVDLDGHDHTGTPLRLSLHAAESPWGPTGAVWPGGLAAPSELPVPTAGQPWVGLAAGLGVALVGVLMAVLLAEVVRLHGWSGGESAWLGLLIGGASLALGSGLFWLVGAWERAVRVSAARMTVLADREARFRRVLENAPFGLLFCRRTDEDRLVLDELNAAAAAWLGLTEPLPPGLPLAAVLPAQGDPEFLERLLHIARLGGRQYGALLYHREPLLGQRASCELVAFQVAPEMVAVACIDVTAREAAAAELHHRDQLLQATAEAVTQLLGGRGLHEGVTDALATLGVAVGADRAYVFETHRDPLTGMPLMSQRYEWCGEGASPQIDNPSLQNVPYFPNCRRWYLALSVGEAINGLVRDFPAEERPPLEAQDIRSLLVLPIRIQDRFWGFIGFDDCHRDRVWTPQEIAVLRTAAAGVGHALTRRRTEETLRDREAHLREVTSQIPGLVFQFVVCADGRRGFRYVNARASAWLGVRMRRSLGLGWFVKHLDPSDRPGFVASVEAAIAGCAPWHFEGCFLRPGGRRLWFRALAEPRPCGNDLIYTGVLLEQKPPDEAPQGAWETLALPSPRGAHHGGPDEGTGKGLSVPLVLRSEAAPAFPGMGAGP